MSNISSLRAEIFMRRSLCQLSNFYELISKVKKCAHLFFTFFSPSYGYFLYCENLRSVIYWVIHRIVKKLICEVCDMMCVYIRGNEPWKCIQAQSLGYGFGEGCSMLFFDLFNHFWKLPGNITLGCREKSSWTRML